MLDLFKLSAINNIHPFWSHCDLIYCKIGFVILKEFMMRICSFIIMAKLSINVYSTVQSDEKMEGFLFFIFVFICLQLSHPPFLRLSNKRCLYLKCLLRVLNDVTRKKEKAFFSGVEYVLSSKPGKRHL